MQPDVQAVTKAQDYWDRKYRAFDGLSIAEALRQGWVTSVEAAELLGVSRKRIGQLTSPARRKARPDLWLPSKRFGHRRLYYREDVEAYARRPRRVGAPKSKGAL
jgi:hypothetical protein